MAQIRSALLEVFDLQTNKQKNKKKLITDSAKSSTLLACGNNERAKNQKPTC